MFINTCVPSLVNSFEKILYTSSHVDNSEYIDKIMT